MRSSKYYPDKPKFGRQQKITNTGTEITEMKTSRILYKINQTNRWFFKRINKIDNPPCAN